MEYMSMLSYGIIYRIPVYAVYYTYIPVYLTRIYRSGTSLTMYMLQFEPLHTSQSTHVMQEMHNLHPYSAPPPHIATEAPPLNLTEEDFDAVLDNLGVGKAPGLTGWTYEHIKQLCSRRAGKQASLTLVNALLSGQLPPVFELQCCCYVMYCSL
jgi:hypothetical protein